MGSGIETAAYSLGIGHDNYDKIEMTLLAGAELTARMQHVAHREPELSDSASTA